MGQLNHARGGKARAAHGASDGGRDDDGAALGEGLIDAHGPAEHADAARRQGAALAPAPDAGGPERATAVRVVAGHAAGRGGGRGPRTHRPGARLAPGDDEGGPGDSPVSVRWIQRGGADAASRSAGATGGPGTRGAGDRPGGSGVRHARARATPVIDLPIGGPQRAGPADRPARRRRADDGGGPGDESAAARRWAREQVAARGGPAATERARWLQPRSCVRSARGRGRGSVAGLSDWERWLELCARIDGFPRHLSIHSGGMLVTAAPLIDIAPIERATMPDRVVVQYDKRDVETMKLIKLDLLGLGMLAAIDECVQLIEHDCAVCLDLDRIPEEIPEVFEMLQAADTVGVFQVESRAQMQTLPKSRPARASTTSSWRSRSSGRARSRATPSTPTCAASRGSSRSPTSIRASSRSCATPWA